MNTCTRLLVAGMAVWALSSGPAWGDIVNGDFSTGLTGWDALALPMDDSSLALAEVVSNQLHVRVANSYVYTAGSVWQPQEPNMSAVVITQNIIPNGGAPLGTTALTFDADVQFYDNPAGNTGAKVIVGVNYAGIAEPWITTASTGGTITIDLPGLAANDPVLYLYMHTFSGLDVLPNPALGHTYNIVVDATFDNFEFVVDGPPLVNVPIDIKPGTSPNTINLGSNGVIPVAICSTDDFDALQVDPLTVTLADAGVRVRGKGKSIFATEDVNGDGLLDMILKIETQGLVLTPDATEALLTGMTYGGVAFQGVGQVTIVPPAVPLPEPSTIMLLILGGMSVLRRRRLRGNNRN